ncbi:MAG: flagellar hook protein FlgE [Gammaproteobacteria bacterium]|nr:flagellar hook protein FlgE [Gammaproteobacteria bacterium]
MSFNISLSGLNAASSELSVTSNNIANVGTTGFKGSRAEFVDIFATSTLGNADNAIGSGVLLSSVTQQFAQGNLEFTQNSLDLAISGEGFFILSPEITAGQASASLFTRAGAFQLNADGYIVNSNGDSLQAYPVDTDGNPLTTSINSTVSLQVPDGVSTPQPTTTVNLNMNLPSDINTILPNFYITDEPFAVASGAAAALTADPFPLDDPAAAAASAAADAIAAIGPGADTDVIAAITNAANNTAALYALTPAPDPLAVTQAIADVANAVALSVQEFDPTDPNQYNYSTSVTVYDSQGSTHIARSYFIQTDDINNTWEVRTTLDGVLLTSTAGTEILDFDQNGNLDLTNSTTNGEIVYDSYDLSLINGSAPLDLTFDFGINNSASTQQVFGPFGVANVEQDGFSTGQLVGLDIGSDGVVRANFSNGRQQALGQIAIAAFDNPQGLTQNGNTTWTENNDSGLANTGQAGTGTYGLIYNGALEQSNVDLTAQLVKLITAQRNFQANSKAIETANTVTQSIINIR